jgi:ribosomal protein L37AE/L43A
MNDRIGDSDDSLDFTEIVGSEYRERTCGIVRNNIKCSQPALHQVKQDNAVCWLCRECYATYIYPGYVDTSESYE